MNMATRIAPPASPEMTERLSPAVSRRFDDEVDQCGYGGDGEDGSRNVDGYGIRVTAFGNEDEACDECDSDDWNVDEEYGTPPEVFEKQSTGDGSDADA